MHDKEEKQIHIVSFLLLFLAIALMGYLAGLDAGQESEREPACEQKGE